MSPSFDKRWRNADDADNDNDNDNDDDAPQAKDTKHVVNLPQGCDKICGNAAI